MPLCGHHRYSGRQARLTVEGHAARIRDPRIAAERPREFTVGAEGENRAVAVAVGSAGAGDEDAHYDPLFVQPMPHAAGSPLPRTCISLDLLVAPSTGLSAGAGVVEVEGERDRAVPKINVYIINRTQNHVLRFDLQYEYLYNRSMTDSP